MLQYLVRLRPTDRDQLFTLVTTGRAAATKQLRARLRLNAEIKAGARRWTAGDIAEVLETSEATGPRGRQAWVEQGLEAALVRTRPTGRPSRQRDGAQEAQRMAVAWSAPPESRARWPCSDGLRGWGP